MKKKAIAILPLATALAAFVDQADARTSDIAQADETTVERSSAARTTVEETNTNFAVGSVKFAVANALLGLKVFRSANGTLMGGHSSHSSHSSHASHASHASSRY